MENERLDRKQGNDVDISEQESIRTAVRSLHNAGYSDCKTLVILGSGLRDIKIGIPSNQITYAEVGFSQGLVSGHDYLLDKSGSVAFMRGRCHLYENISSYELARPIRTFAKLGVKNVIITNAAGAVNPEYRAGDIIFIKDQINLTGSNPLVGPNFDEFGTRFPNLSNMYNNKLRSGVFFKCISDPDLHRAFPYDHFPLQEGVFAGLSGPSYETPAEVKMLRTIGADVVGMSMVHEAIISAHCGLKVLGLSVIANAADGVDNINHTMVEKRVSEAAGMVQDIIKIAIAEMEIL